MSIHRLTPAKIRQVISAGKRRAYSDGNNLYLHVAGEKSPGRASWVFRYMIDGKARTMGLGAYGEDRDGDVSLARARDKAREERVKLKHDGVDPLEVRKAKDTAELKAMTFRQCAEAYVAAHAPSWRNPKHAAQWPATLGAYAHPVFGDLPVSDVDTPLVLKALRREVTKGARKGPLWEVKTETASRVRQRIEAVLDWARVGGYRTGENPARWTGHLEYQLPAPGRIAKAKHHDRLEPDPAAIGDFMAALRQREGISALALEFTILTSARTGEVTGATWAEIDLREKVWTVPAERMKAGREHRVPLSPAALAVLEKVAPGNTGPDAYVFPGQSQGKPLSNMAMLMLLKDRMGRPDLTVHGFRSTFRDWAGEKTSFPSDVVEMAQAHTIKNKVEAAYRRGDMLERRRELMEAWANVCAGPVAADSKIKPLFGEVAA